MIFQLIALNSNAQYKKLTKGEINPFDTAVAVRIDVYRMESQKLKLADSLLSGYRNQLKIQRIEIDQLRNVLDNKEKIIKILNKEIARKSKLNDEMIKKYEGLIEDLNNKRFYQKPEFWGICGLVIGILIN